MTINTALIVASAIVTISATVPYIIQVIKRNTKPRVVSWFNWSLLAAIGAAAAFSKQQYPSAVLSICGAVECMAIVILGLWYGDRKFEFIDIACQIGAVIGLILWFTFDSPLLALLSSQAIDFIAGLPTVKHLWQKPHEESVSVFVLSCIGALLALSAISDRAVVGLIVPIYITLINASMILVYLLSPNKRVTSPIRQSD